MRRGRRARRGGRPLAAICAAPSIVAELGCSGAAAPPPTPASSTCSPSRGRSFSDEPVVVDGNLITSQGAGTAMLFALETSATTSATRPWSASALAWSCRGTVGRAGLTYRDYAAFARQTPEEIARACEVQVFRASGPGGQGVNTTDSGGAHAPRPHRHHRGLASSEPAAEPRALRREDLEICRRRACAAAPAQRRPACPRPRSASASTPSAPAARSSSSAAAWTGSKARALRRCAQR